jgi:hypothetical protein
VAAVARTWTGPDDAERFTAIVSDESLRNGANDLELYLLRGERHDLRGAVRIA